MNEPPATRTERAETDMGRNPLPSNDPYELDGDCEERCCPSFWADKGVPPIPILSWVFDPENKYLNKNKYAEKFGQMGLVFCDRHRKRFMGTALGVTVIAIVITTYGCFALSSDQDIVQYTNWGVAWYRNETAETAVKAYLGLVKFIITECEGVKNNKAWSYDDCDIVLNKRWDDLSGSDVEDYGIDWSSMEDCRAEAESNQFGAFSTCATLIFALIGCLTRIRRIADTNFQKILGCLPDTFGVISLLYALVSFATGCYGSMPDKVNGFEAHYRIGPGYAAYAACLCAAFIRVTMHYLTPTPGNGTDLNCAGGNRHDSESDGAKLTQTELPSIA